MPFGAKGNMGVGPDVLKVEGGDHKLSFRFWGMGMKCFLFRHVEKSKQ